MATVNIDVKVIAGAALAVIRGLERQTKATADGFKKLNSNLEATNKIAKNIGTTFKSVLGAGFVQQGINQLVSGFKQLVKSSIDITVSLEKAAARFQVFTGSVESANQFVRELAQLEDETPFEFEQIANAAQKLLAFGRSTEQVKSDIRALGDIATASGANIEELANIFGKAASVGQVTSRELNALQSQSIPIIDALSKQLGVSGATVKKLANEGKIGFGQFEQALVSLSQKGGFAFEAMTKQSQTLGGRIKSLGDAFEAVQIEVGKQLSPALKAAASSFTTLINKIADNIKVNKLSSGSGQLLITTIQVLSDVVNVLVATFQAFKVIGLTVNSLLFAIVGVVTIVIESFFQLANAISKITGANFTWLDSATKKLETFRKASFDTANQLLADSDAELKAGEELDKKFAKFNKNLQAGYDAEIAKSKESTNESTKSTNTKISNINTLTDAQIEAGRKKLEETAKFNEQILLLNEELALAEEEAKLVADGVKSEDDALALLKLQDRLATERELALQQQALLLGDQRAYAALVLKNEADQIKRQNKIKEDEVKLDKQRRETLLQNTAGMFGALASLASTGGARLFKIAKAFNLAEAITSGILAVQKAASALPYPANIPGVIAETARAAANVIRIKQTEPSFQQGGIVPGSSFSGDNIKANVNSGEMILNRRQQANLFAIANNGGGSGEVVVYTSVKIGEQEIAQAVSRQVAQGMKLGESGV